MKKIILSLVLLSGVVFTAAAGLKVKISNPTPLARHCETVEIPWLAVAAAMKGVTAQNVAVCDASGAEIPSQVVYNGSEEPQLLIFQVTLAARAKAMFEVTDGRTVAEYPVQAYGRYVPERLDDYAWENNLVAYRLYGPRLTDPVSPGIDVWVKSTERMVIDERFKRGQYHHNFGDGMDCYKVGRTLGAGACAPLSGGRLWLSRNYAGQERLDNGPLRTTVRLTYDDFDVDGRKVSMVKYIELDANSYFNKMVNVYSDSADTLCVAAGMVLHRVKRRLTGDKFAAVTEAASDSKQPDVDGDISLAVIVPAGCGTEEVSAIESYGRKRAPKAKHLVVKSLLLGDDKTLVYWSGSAWSGAGMTAERWEQEVRDKLYAIEHPLKVKFRH